MSEPVSNARVEDVLASIRRLVSRNERPARGQGSSSGDAVAGGTDSFGPDGGPAVGGRFVLTPSLRVTDPDPVPETEAAVDKAGAAESDEDWHDDIWSEASLGEGSSEPVRADATRSDDTAPSAEVDALPLDAAAEDRTSVLRLDESVRLPDDARDVQAGDGDASASALDDRASETGGPGATPKSTILVRTVGADGGAVVDEPGAVGGVPDDLGEPATGSMHAEIVDDTDFGPAEDVMQAQARREDLSSRGDGLESKIAALEAAIARTEDNWEPDGVAADPYSGTTPPAMTWNDAEPATGRDAPYRLEPEARRDVRAMGAAKAAGAVAKLPAGSVTSMPSQLDEDMLRAFVADIVRQELQGALGERVTRNVRKLVRREILRALESRDFD